MSRQHTRRSMLASMGATSVVALAGCSGSDDSDGADDSNGAEETTPTEPATMSISLAVSVYPTAPGSARLLMAREQETFADHNLEVEEVVSFDVASATERNDVFNFEIVVRERLLVSCHQQTCRPRSSRIH
jgi:hypothetical protein